MPARGWGRGLLLASVAEHGDAGVDLVGMRQAGAAHPALLALAAVDEELELEVALLAVPGAVVAEGGALRVDGRLEDTADVLEEQS